MAQMVRLAIVLFECSTPWREITHVRHVLILSFCFILAWFHLRDTGNEDPCDNDYLDDLKERIDMSFEDEDDPSHSDEEDESSADEDELEVVSIEDE